MIAVVGDGSDCSAVKTSFNCCKKHFLRNCVDLKKVMGSVENYKLKTLLYLINFSPVFGKEEKTQIKIKPRSGLYTLRSRLANT